MGRASYVPGELIPLPLSGSIPELPHVEKDIFGRLTKFFRTADAFHARRREGPNRFAQTQPRIPVMVLKSRAAAERPNNRPSRDFWSRSIFDFFNSICHEQMWSRQAAQRKYRAMPIPVEHAQSVPTPL